MTASNFVSEPARRLRRIRLAGLVAAAITALLGLTTGEAIDRSLFDAWQRLSPRDLSATDVRVVLIDSDSLAAVGPWPWPRYHLARLTEEIASRGARAIGFDMLFPEPDRVRPDIFTGLYPELSAGAAAEIAGLEPMDRLFGRVIGKAPVVLGRAAIDDRRASPDQLPIDALFSGPLPASLPVRSGARANIPELEQTALGHGLLNGQPDSDGTVRRVPLLMRVGDRPMPGFALEMARVGLGVDDIGATPGALMLGGRRIPVDEQGRMMPRFGAFPMTRVSSAADVLRRHFPADAFAGKIVLIGLAAEGTADIVATPLASEAYGTLVQAEAIDAILRGGSLARPLWATTAEWGMGLLLTATVLLLVPARRRGWLAAPLLLAATIIAAAWIAFDGYAWLVDPIRPLMLGAGGAIGVFGGMFVEARRERERLRETLLHERIAAAATEGELQAARTIQLGMLPDRASLTKLDPRLDIDALLEPARSVGGDFFDVARLDADHILFLIADVTGKGVPAALFMALSKALAKSVLLRGSADLAEAAATLNAELSRDNGEAMGVTMLIGVIDLRNGEIAMINAGHENPLLLRADREVAVHAMEGGPPFCIVDYPWPEERLILTAGQTLLLFTDGVSEAQNDAGELFGNARILAASSGDQARETVESVRSAVRAFEAGAEPSDDMTVMAVRYLGRGAQSSEP